MYKIIMPKLGMTMKAGFVTKCFKKEGEEIVKDELLFEIESSKIINEVKSPANGFIKKIFAIEEKEYKVGEVLALIAETENELNVKVENNVAMQPVNNLKNEQRSNIKQKKTFKRNSDNINIVASPAAKRLAKKMGVNLSMINGTGPNGRIIEKDILNYNNNITLSSGAEKELKFTEEKLSPTRLTIAKKLETGFHKGVFVTQATLTSCENLFKIKEKINISITAIFIKMLSLVLQKMPMFNAHFDGEKIKKFIDINIGVATNTKYGLMVPVVKQADKKDLERIGQEIKFLVGAAKSKTLTNDQIGGSTFTISNIGISRTDLFTPILNFPEVAILGAGRVYRGIKVSEDNSFKIERQVWLSLSYDHRVIDGFLAAEFLGRLCAFLENSENIVLLL